MADWRKVAMGAILIDGKVDDREVRILKKEVLADRKVSKDEVEFLIELRNKAASVTPAFKELFFGAIKQNVLLDGAVSAGEAKWLRKMVYADRKVDSDEKKFLRDLKAEAKKVSPEFTALYEECAK